MTKQSRLANPCKAERSFAGFFKLPFRLNRLDWNAISDEFRAVIEKSGYEVISGRQDGLGV